MMAHLDYPDEFLRDVLKDSQVVALVGASPKPQRNSHRVMAFLQQQGFRVIPVNPLIAGEQLLGERVYRTLEDIPFAVDLVDVFRNSEAAAEACEEAVRIGAKAIWMQVGVINKEAARRCRNYGLKVVMDRCPKMEITRLGLEGLHR